MKGNSKFGAILAVGGILTGFLVLFLLAQTYMPIVEGKIIITGRPDEALTVRIVHALLGWVGMTAGALWVVVLYGFLNNKDWAWGWGVVASTLQILAGFFPMIPAKSINYPTPTIWVFLIAFVLWFGMLFIGGVGKKIITLAFFSGIVYILTFIDGVGSISRYQTSQNSFAIGMYAMGQMINWWAAIVWVVFIYALVKRKSWAYPMGLFATSMSIFGGFPVGITDVVMIGRFSMFLVAPVMSTIMLVIFLFPGTRRLLETGESVNE